MKTFSIALVAATLMASAAPAFAGENADSPTYKEQMTNLWIATGDATYAKLAGLNAEQIAEQRHMPVERSLR